jgi:hypothetical protein
MITLTNRSTRPVLNAIGASNRWERHVAFRKALASNTKAKAAARPRPAQSAMATINALALEHQRVAGGTVEAATASILRANPRLYERYLVEQSAGGAR